MKTKRISLANVQGRLSKGEMKKIMGGYSTCPDTPNHQSCGHGSASCNPSLYYGHPCSVNYQCWGSSCQGTLYCCETTGTCLFC